MDDNHLETLLLPGVELLAARNLFDQFLHNDFVVVVGLTGCDLDVVVGGEHDAFDRGGARSSRLELLKLTFDLVHVVGRVELLEKALDQRPFACS